MDDKDVLKRSDTFMRVFRDFAMEAIEGSDIFIRVRDIEDELATVKSKVFPHGQTEPERHGRPWSGVEDEILIRQFVKAVEKIASSHGRTTRSIAIRLKRNRIITRDGMDAC